MSTNLKSHLRFTDFNLTVLSQFCSAGSAKSLTLPYKQADFPYFFYFLAAYEGLKYEVFHSCSNAAQISLDHMKSSRLYSRPGQENYSPARSTLALNLN